MTVKNNYDDVKRCLNESQKSQESCNVSGVKLKIASSHSVDDRRGRKTRGFRAVAETCMGGKCRPLLAIKIAVHVAPGRVAHTRQPPGQRDRNHYLIT